MSECLGDRLEHSISILNENKTIILELNYIYCVKYIKRIARCHNTVNELLYDLAIDENTLAVSE